MYSPLRKNYGNHIFQDLCEYLDNLPENPEKKVADREKSKKKKKNCCYEGNKYAHVFDFTYSQM